MSGSATHSFVCRPVTESCNKYLRGFTMSLRKGVEESIGRYVLYAEVCVYVCVCVGVLREAKRGELADG